jgi:hypothetical protein
MAGRNARLYIGQRPATFLAASIPSVITIPAFPPALAALAALVLPWVGGRDRSHGEGEGEAGCHQAQMSHSLAVPF